MHRHCCGSAHIVSGEDHQVLQIEELREVGIELGEFLFAPTELRPSAAQCGEDVRNPFGPYAVTKYVNELYVNNQKNTI